MRTGVPFDWAASGEARNTAPTMARTCEYLIVVFSFAAVSACCHLCNPVYLPIVRERNKDYCMSLAGWSYREVCETFSWSIPANFNIAEAICDRHVGAGRTALIYETVDGRSTEFTFEHLQERS